MTKQSVSTEPGHTMQCMEVWGGNAASDNGVVMPGLDAWVYSLPHAGDAGGGDVHYVSSCATGRITRVLVADVSGHGQGVAEIAVTLRNLMRRYINFVDQTRLVRSLNKEFTELSQLGRFATAVVATYWTPTNSLVVCNAGHPRPMLYRAESKKWESLRAARNDRHADHAGGRTEPSGPPGESVVSNLPLGIDDMSGYDHFAIELHPGDLVLVYTDSIIECSNAASGRMLGESGVLGLLSTLDASKPETLIPNLIDRLRSVTASDGLDDDLTLLLLRHNGTQIRAAALQGLMAPLRIARSILERLVRGERRIDGLPEVSVPAIGGAVIPALGRRWKPRRK